MAAGTGDGDAVDGGFDLAVAAAVEAVAAALARADPDGCAMPAARPGLASEENQPAPAISPTSLAAVNGPRPGLAEQLRRDLSDEPGDLWLEGLDRLRELSDAAQLIAGDTYTHGLPGAR